MRVRKLLILSASLIATVPAYAATATRISAFEYDQASGLLKKEFIEPDNPDFCLVTTYTYDAYGNKDSATTSNCAGASGVALFEERTSRSTFGAEGVNPEGRFPTTSTNALNQSESKTYDPRVGGVKRLTGPNGIQNYWYYDDFGRKRIELRADGTQSTWDYIVCGACSTNGAAYYVQQTSTGSPTSKVYYDKLNREIRSETQGFNGALVYKDTEYDDKGRVKRVSKPYYDGEAVYWTSFGYDTLGRVETETQPTTSSGTVKTTTVYSGLTTTVTVSNNDTGTNLPEGVAQTKTTLKNSQGQTVSVTDVQGNVVSYYYDPFGNLKVTNAGGVYTVLGYDLRGRKESMTDPDMGFWTYAYDALGQLKRQTDAKSQVTEMSYDKLGRMTNRTEPDLVSTWTYDNCTKGVGKLCTATSDNAYSRTVGYDDLGRVASIDTHMDNSDYHIGYSYDGNGRLAQTTYPTGFVTRNVYNGLGYLQQVTDGGTLAYWQANIVSATGKVKKEILGNGLTSISDYDELDRMKSNTVAGGAGPLQNFSYMYDTIGNMTQRVDAVNSVTENFLYDKLNRLTLASGPSSSTREQRYDALGNITYKSDAGTYTYALPGSYRPHAVSRVAGTVNGSFTYDANGSLTSGLSRTLTYTSFNMPASVTAANNMLPGTNVRYDYSYNAEHERVRNIITRADGVFTTYYLHPAGKGQLLYEKEVKPTGTEYKHYINAGGILVGVHITRSDSTTATRYFHRDHLGSLTLITNASGGQIEQFAYEAFGKRRYASGTADPAGALYGITTDRGFTSHEHLDEMGLIHMNGRVYDPLVGRFMTADPFVQAPGNLQSYNRYSYVLNNPLMYYDPTGYFSLRKLLKAAVAITAIVVIGPAVYENAFWWAIGVGFEGAAITAVAGAVSGATVGGILGGTFNGGLTGAFQGAVWGGFSGGIFGGVSHVTADWNLGSQSLAHASAGCFAATTQSGDCAKGARSAALGHLANKGFLEATEMMNGLKEKSIDWLTRQGIQVPAKIFDAQRCWGYCIGGSREHAGYAEGKYDVISLSGFANVGMPREGMLLSGDSPWYYKIPGVYEVVQATAKFHDFGNSWRYDWSNGLFVPFQSGVANDVFNAFSMSTMVPAALATAIAIDDGVQAVNLSVSGQKRR